MKIPTNDVNSYKDNLFINTSSKAVSSRLSTKGASYSRGSSARGKQPLRIHFNFLG